MLIKVGRLVEAFQDENLNLIYVTELHQADRKLKFKL